MEYKDTIFLPKTSFEMRANLPSKEPAIIEEWDKENIFKKLRDKSKGREKFVLHDGPPYANGHIHMGTALNKILKDVIVRTQQMAGKDSIYVPGWDCHGLPIEWKIEEEYRKKGKNKDDIPTVQFRNECRESLQKNGSRYKKKNLDGLVLKGIGKIHISQCPIKQRHKLFESLENFFLMKVCIKEQNQFSGLL